MCAAEPRCKAPGEELIEIKGGPYGENLALGFPTAAQGIDAWAAEEQQYNYAKATFSEQTGHFTQLVWEDTTKVGCAAVQCANDATDGANGLYLVCEYHPRGNVLGEFKSNVRKPGESANGQEGLGAAPRLGGCSRLLVALVAVSSFVVTYM